MRAQHLVNGYSMASAVAILLSTGPAHAFGSFGADVAADCKRFTSTAATPEMPGFGDFFMQEGVMYRAGTFDKYCPDTFDCGFNADGTPQFPDEIVGKWTCWGSFVGNGIATSQGVWLYSTQVYELYVEELEEYVFTPGRHQLISSGPERLEQDVPFQRAITGGAGWYRSASGEVTQTKIGINQTECENFTFDFRLNPRFPFRHGAF